MQALEIPIGCGWLSLGDRWLKKQVGSAPFATAALWVRIQTYLKNTKWATRVRAKKRKGGRRGYRVAAEGRVKGCWGGGG